jgi:hypothetical protein
MSQNRLPSFGILEEPLVVLKVADIPPVAKFENISRCHPFVYRIYSDESKIRYIHEHGFIQPTRPGAKKSIRDSLSGPSLDQLINHIDWEKEETGLISTSLSLSHIAYWGNRRHHSGETNIYIAIIKSADLVDCAFTVWKNFPSYIQETSGFRNV